MIKVLWVVGGVTGGFLFSKAMYVFTEFVLQAIKNSEEDRQMRLAQELMVLITVASILVLSAFGLAALH